MLGKALEAGHSLLHGASSPSRVTPSDAQLLVVGRSFRQLIPLPARVEGQGLLLVSSSGNRIAWLDYVWVCQRQGRHLVCVLIAQL